MDLFQHIYRYDIKRFIERPILVCLPISLALIVGILTYITGVFSIILIALVLSLTGVWLFLYEDYKDGTYRQLRLSGQSFAVLILAKLAAFMTVFASLMVISVLLIAIG